METTMQMNYRSSHKVPSLLPVLMLTALVVFSSVVVYSSVVIYNQHAEIKHGDEALAVRKCLENNDPLQTWVKMLDGRVFKVCLLPTGQFGIQICEGIKECTSFIFRESKGLRVKLEQVERYLRNIGAERIYYP